MLNPQRYTDGWVQIYRELRARNRYTFLNHLALYTFFCWSTNLYSESQIKVLIGYASFSILTLLRLGLSQLQKRIENHTFKKWFWMNSCIMWTSSLAWGLFAGSIYYSRSFDLTANILLYCTLALAIESLILHTVFYRFFFLNLTFLMGPPLLALFVHRGHLNIPYFMMVGLSYVFLILAGRLLNIEITSGLRKNVIIQQQKAEIDIARDKATEASKIKSQFVSNISHDLRSPMNEIIGLTGILLDKNLEPETRKIAETIRESSENLLTIINDILDFSRLETGRVELEYQPCEIAHCIESTFLILEAKAKAKRLDLDYSISKLVPAAIITDATRLRQILVNLVGNAVKFTERGSIKVVVEKTADKENGVELQFAVQDTGIGIPQTRVDRLFKSFSQIDGTMARKFGGTGLGLAICKRLTELLGGQIWVKSKFGYGSTFYFTILAQPAPMSAKADSKAPSEAKLADENPLQILIAEDNNVNQTIMLRLLEKLGYRADIVSNGFEAIEALKRKRYDLVFMDVQMPELSGHEAARIICDTWSRDHRPFIVAVTATLTEEDRELCREVGMDNLIIKPVRLDELVRIIKLVPKRQLSEGSEKFQLPTPQPIWGDLTIDFSQMLRIAGGDKALLSAAINSFIEESDNLVEKLQLSVNQRDVQEFETTANAIKQRASTFIATPIIRLILDAEKYFKNSQYNTCLEVIEKLKLDITALNQILTEIYRTNLAA